MTSGQPHPATETAEDYPTPQHDDVDDNGASGAVGVIAVTTEGSWLRRLWGRYLARLNTTGILVGVLSAWASLTPSLIPRDWVIQGVFTGLALISGYGIGIFIGWILDTIGVGDLATPTVRRILRWSYGFLAAVGTVTMLFLSSGWQNEVRALLDMPPAARWPFVGVPVIVLVLAGVILQVARILRWISLKITALFARRFPPRFSRLVAVLIVAWLASTTFSGVLWSSILEGLESTFALANEAFDDDVEAPVNAERSGSPASDASWESLGLQGRRFVTGGPTVEQIAAFQAARPGSTSANSGTDDGATSVREPIRAYAGLDGGSDLNLIASEVVAELDRTNAWERDVLVVATATGTGWVDASMPDSLELMHGGNTAVASMQYSNLPSWLSFIGDQSTPPIAGRALFEAVYEAWEAKPEESRPKLIVFGISLGSFGTQGAFSGIQDVASRTDGALLVGTPGFTPTWKDVTNRRDPGSLQIAPVYQDGRTVRFMTGPPGSNGDPLQLPGEWEEPRIVVAQHASDGVTWWSPELLWDHPDWLKEPRGSNVSSKMRWFPMVTFWQLTADLFFSADEEIPMGHGHHYKLEYSDGLAMIVPPEEWSAEDTTFLRTVIAGREDVDEPAVVAPDEG